MSNLKYDVIFFQFSVLLNCYKKLFTTSQYAYAETSVVDVKNVVRGYPTNVYLQNQNVEKFSHEVVIDVDYYAVGLVRILIKILDYQKN